MTTRRLVKLSVSGEVLTMAKRTMTARRPYRLPRLFGEEVHPSVAEMFGRFAARAAWRGDKGDGGGCSAAKATREDIARWHLTPSTLEAVARWLLAIRDHARGQRGDQLEQPVDWLYKGTGCTRRVGDLGDVSRASSYALEGVLAILVKMPIEDQEDAETLLDLLRDCSWDLPAYERKRVAQRMARYVSDCILRERFKPMVT